MIKISGKQRFGAVWVNGECIAVFNKGVAYTNDSTKADILRAKGYTVEGEPDSVAPTPDFSEMTVAELTAYAEEHGIDLGGATKKADILKAVQGAG